MLTMNLTLSKKENTIDRFIDFIENICIKSKKSTIRTYLKIFDIDSRLILGPINKKCGNEISKLVNIFLKYPTMHQVILNYFKHNDSKIDFLKKYSDEQITYITSLNLSDSKLIACAGSGKTRSIIGRIKFLVDHKLVDKENVFAITFSKHAAEDFHRKIVNLFPDYMSFCNLKNFSTIDSLAKSILVKFKTHKSENVEILSIAFRNFLKEMTDTDLEKMIHIKNIKHLFIDEAQDLNEVQYDIAMLLKKRLGTVIHLIGDPNQNIFQFRRSSSSYLINFESRKFELTKNFRSTQEIIDFSESIKPIATSKSISATNKRGPKVTITTGSTSRIHQSLIYFINMYQKQKDLSNIAIICPTRGIGSYDNIGLSVFFNLFKMNNIPFIQLYDESGSVMERKKITGRIPGHINLITYHGTKGLEFDVVFVMDFYYFLFNIKPSEEEHRIARYLLYVATSRAISMMFICIYNNMNSGYINHWITHVPSEYYIINSPLKIPALTYRNDEIKTQCNGITELISELSDEKLDMIHDMLKVKDDFTLYTRRMYQEFTNIDRGKDETLFGIFCEELFYLQLSLGLKKTPRKLPIIELIIEMNFVVIEDETDQRLLKKYVVDNNLSWNEFDEMRSNIPDNVVKLIEKYFDRNNELNNCIICTSSFIKIVEDNLEDIENTYQRYIKPSTYNYDYTEILSDFFYLIVVGYAYDNNHYFYINNHGNEKKQLLMNGIELYEKMNFSAIYDYLSSDIEPKIRVYYPKMMLIGEIDFIESDKKSKIETIVEIKCVKEMSIKYYIQLILYNFCYYYQRGQMEKIFINKYKIINLLTGLEYHFIAEISPINMFNILIILAETGNLKFRNMNLVYDLETSDRINTVGPYPIRPNIPRCIAKRRGNQYYVDVLPEITEISIKDYETGMILINTLVKINGCIPPEVQKITGINHAMLTKMPDIEMIQKIMEHKTKNFINCKMMAHNGNNFDNIIILYEKLVNPNNFSFLDTLSIIPIHLPSNIKLSSKKLSDIYQLLFHKKFKAHRAMEDVNALIKIMKFLKIAF